MRKLALFACLFWIAGSWSDYLKFPETSYSGTLQPQVIGIGVQKAGTTSLAAYLTALNWLEVSQLHGKELHFFDNQVFTFLELRRNNSFREEDYRQFAYRMYLRNWPDVVRQSQCNATYCSAAPSKFAFEFTPRYFSDRRVPWLLRETLPHWRELKFLLVLRDPIERSLSGYSQQDKHVSSETVNSLALEELDVLSKCYSALNLSHISFYQTQHDSEEHCSDGFEQYDKLYNCLKSTHTSMQWFSSYLRRTYDVPNVALKEGVLSRGLYLDQLKNYLCAGFKPEQFLIFLKQEISDDPRRVLERFNTFMGHSPGMNQKAKQAVDQGIVRNIKPKPVFLPETRAKVHDFFATPTRELVKFLIQHRFNVDVRRLLTELEHFHFKGNHSKLDD